MTVPRLSPCRKVKKTTRPLMGGAPSRRSGKRNCFIIPGMFRSFGPIRYYLMKVDGD